MESLTRCVSGHYYDSGRHTSCPFCGVQGLDVDFEKTRAKRSGAEGDIPPTKPMYGAAESPEGVTKGIFRKRMGMEPVVGWLVAVSGPERGHDYRIISDKNYIGRSEQMEISIAGDETISRENHAIIAYNPKKQVYRLVPGESKRLAYLNDEEVLEPMFLKAYDVIELGETKLLFIPFCGKEFHWDMVGDK